MPSPTPTNPNPTQQKRQPQGRRPRQKSRYGTSLSEKQDLKKIFDVREEQLKKYYRQAQKAQGQTGSMLVSLLERRLDNALFRAGFAQTRPQARQMATHRLFTINGKPVDIPSYELKTGDVVAVKENKKNKAHFSSFEKRMQNISTPSWILLDPETFSFKVTAMPNADEANLGIDIRAVVEFFAR